MCLVNHNSAEVKSETKLRLTSLRRLYHQLQEVPVVVDNQRGKGSSPEKVEAHAQVENCVKMSSCPYFPHQSVVRDDIQQN